MERVRSEWRVVRRVYWGLFACLAVLAAVGVIREHRISVLTASINSGITADLKFADVLEVARRVAARLQYVARYGPIDEVATWPLRTPADALLAGSGCGDAAVAVGAVLHSHGRPFRIVQANLREAGASHILIETQDDDQRWVLLDPLVGRGFSKSRGGPFLGIDEIRALPLAERSWLADEYRIGEWSLFMPYRRTNWEQLGPFVEIFAALTSDKWMREVSVRALMIGVERRLGEIAMGAIALLAVAGVLARSGRGPATAY